MLWKIKQKAGFHSYQTPHVHIKANLGKDRPLLLTTAVTINATIKTKMKTGKLIRTSDITQTPVTNHFRAEGESTALFGIYGKQKPKKPNLQPSPEKLSLLTFSINIQVAYANIVLFICKHKKCLNNRAEIQYSSFTHVYICIFRLLFPLHATK